MENYLYNLFYQQEDKHWWFLIRRKLVHKLIKLYRPYPGRLSILDVGCGMGKLTEELSEYGEVTGIDKSGEAVKFSKKRGLNNIIKSSIEDYATNKRFDCVIALDILEHCRNDNEAMEKIYGLLTKRGIAIIFVPALKLFWGKWDITNHHFRRYDYKELADKFEGADFEILTQSYFNFFLSPIIFAVRKIINLLKIEVDEEFKINNPLINSVCKFIFNLEILLLPKIKYPFGASLMGVYKK